MSISASGINNDDAGIFVTCDKGQEGKCLREMNDLLSQVCHKVYEKFLMYVTLIFFKYIEMNGNDELSTKDQIEAKNEVDSSDCEDVESSIAKELQSMKPSTTPSNLSFVKLDIPCGQSR